MANRKRYVSELTTSEREMLEKGFKTGIKHRERQRAEAILLSASGLGIDELVVRFGVNRDTISRWLTAWSKRRMDGLREGHRSGRRPVMEASVQKK